jgi:hypothetical protein
MINGEEEMNFKYKRIVPLPIKKKKRHGVLSPHLSHVSCTLFSDFSLPPCCDQNDTASVVLLSVTHNYNMTMGTWAFDSPLIEGHSAKTLTSIPQNCRGY